MFNKNSVSYNNTYVNTDSNDTLSIKERYKILIAARNFHYENFNKWMSYFYVMIASIILGFSYIISKGNPNYQEKLKSELLVLSLAGFIISLLWYWANKGYYYWNINFITLINYYEEKLLKFAPHERVYFVFANKSTQNNYLSPISGANFSTSKISILLSFFFSWFFGFYFLYMLLRHCYSLLLKLSKEKCLDVFLEKCLSDSFYKVLKNVLNLLLSYIEFIWIPVFVALTIFYLSGILGRYFLFSYHKHFPDLRIKTIESEYVSRGNFNT
ncbi:hypothetical protein GCM10007424_17420 [Flavobacterium suaedae]|uniref:Uncharacterized protein n=1 Tax=Flavobacterium suaedae TaxID=1767027 RepID=A0ABQ1JVJ4_9FLAO|nr:hypothetical protein [Flavobacterium suaedae]GGB77852.1 hypothetical protein GCM10007424_17420 [Flavobacterium suaedae]